MSWQRGRAEIARLLDGGALKRVAPSPDVADRLVGDTVAHIRLANRGIEDDPPERCG